MGADLNQTSPTTPPAITTLIAHDAPTPAEKSQLLDDALDSGLNPLIEDRAGNSLLHLIVAHGLDPELIRRLFGQLPIDSRNSGKMTPLMVAAEQNSEEAVRTLLGLGAQTSLALPDGRFAASLTTNPTVRGLLETAAGMRELVGPVLFAVQPAEEECAVCLDARPTEALLLCGHVCICSTCYQERLTEKVCPVCREPILGSIDVSRLVAMEPTVRTVDDSDTVEIPPSLLPSGVDDRVVISSDFSEIGRSDTPITLPDWDEPTPIPEQPAIAAV